MKMTIPKRENFCYSCQKLFEVGQEIVSQLMEDFSRIDTCLNCLVPVTKSTIWKQKYQQKVSLKDDDRDEMASIWKLLPCVKNDEAYILALYLVRKKILAKRGNSLYEHLETGETVRVEAVDLKQVSIAKIHANLQACLL